MIRSLDLFHGAGGSSFGARMAGAQIVAGIDYWEVASDCYKVNFPEALAINADIREVSPRELHRLIGEINLLLASPECTNHSCAKGAGNRSEESRLTAFQVIRFALEFNPTWIVIENVVQMKKWSRHLDLVTELDRLGYHVKEEKIDSKLFGVPQARKRLFLLCSKQKIYYSSPPLREIKPARTIIHSNGCFSMSPLFNRRRAEATIERAKRAILALGENRSFLIVYYSTDGCGGWQSLEQPLRTVTTLDRFAYVVPTPAGYMMRMLQPEELKLAMGFPSHFLLECGSRRDKIKLMGNAVCPPVMEHIVRNLTNDLPECERENSFRITPESQRLGQETFQAIPLANNG
jgi:DNA (cytosine-5)-methyltransferase 1